MHRHNAVFLACAAHTEPFDVTYMHIATSSIQQAAVQQQIMSTFAAAAAAASSAPHLRSHPTVPQGLGTD
jgi:hypothetical protein